MPETADRCPGVLRLHEAADGALARVRLPGGLLASGQLGVLAAAARELGDGRLELTSRGNVQLRALAPDAAPELQRRLEAAGLLPSASHERVRNILASSLAGVDAGEPLEPHVRELDRRLCATPRLAGLSGRFLFGLDDGRGDIAALAPDVLAVVTGGDRPEDVAGRMLAEAHAFLDACERAGVRAWRVADLPGEPSGPVPPVHESPAHPAGLLDRAGGGSALVLLAPLGRLTAHQAEWLADAGGAGGVRVTPWRSVVLPYAGSREAAEARGRGLGVTADSSWRGVSACAGRPGCAHALADVQHDAAASRDRWPGRIVHWSGCERHCGRPADTEIDVVATATGYVTAGAVHA